MTREEVIDYCEMSVLLEPANEDIFNYIIKELEQKPILDKIREDINSLHNGCGLFNDGVDASLKIIDKYRTESENDKRRTRKSDRFIR